MVSLFQQGDQRRREKGVRVEQRSLCRGRSEEEDWGWGIASTAAAITDGYWTLAAWQALCQVLSSFFTRTTLQTRKPRHREAKSL